MITVGLTSTLVFVCCYCQSSGLLIVNVERPGGLAVYSCRRPNPGHPPRHVASDFRLCSCGRAWDKGLPCRHILYVLGSRVCLDKKLPEEVALPYYRLSTLATLYDTGSFTMPDFTRLYLDQDVVPPPDRESKKRKRGPTGPRQSREEVEVYPSQRGVTAAAVENGGWTDEDFARDAAVPNAFLDRDGQFSDPRGMEDFAGAGTVTVTHEAEDEPETRGRPRTNYYAIYLCEA